MGDCILIVSAAAAVVSASAVAVVVGVAGFLGMPKDVGSRMHMLLARSWQVGSPRRLANASTPLVSTARQTETATGQ